MTIILMSKSNHQRSPMKKKYSGHLLDHGQKDNSISEGSLCPQCLVYRILHPEMEIEPLPYDE